MLMFENHYNMHIKKCLSQSLEFIDSRENNRENNYVSVKPYERYKSHVRGK